MTTLCLDHISIIGKSVKHVWHVDAHGSLSIRTMRDCYGGFTPVVFGCAPNAHRTCTCIGMRMMHECYSIAPKRRSAHVPSHTTTQHPREERKKRVCGGTRAKDGEDILIARRRGPREGELPPLITRRASTGCSATVLSQDERIRNKIIRSQILRCDKP